MGPDRSLVSRVWGGRALTVFMPLTPTPTPTPGCSSGPPARLMPGWFVPTPGARSALRLSLSYCAYDSGVRRTERALQSSPQYMDSRMSPFKPSIFDIPCPFLLTSPEGPDSSAFLNPNRVPSLYVKKTKTCHQAIARAGTRSFSKSFTR